MEKAVQAEAELFAILELKRNNAVTVLADETRLRSHVRVTRGYLTKCIEVPFITEIQDLPNLKKIYKMFPSIPKGCLKKSNMEVGILLGQNANALLPTGGTGEHQIDHLRVWRTVLGEHGYVLEGYHPDIWKSEVGSSKINLLKKTSK